MKFGTFDYRSHRFANNIYRLYVRIFDGNEHSKEGWIPASILDIKQTSSAIYGDRANDAAYRREYVFT